MSESVKTIAAFQEFPADSADGIEDEPRPSIAREFVWFIQDNKKWWMIPLFGMFGLLGSLLALSKTAIAPFIYSLF